jgi:SAM-dependent methyltransferase
MPEMMIFSEYARYYDLLYRDKDYAGEVEYVHGLIQAHAPGAKSLLNLGCGSGRHDLMLAELGYDVCGVDLSAEMLSFARAAAGIKKIEYEQGDVRTIRLNRQFDAVISLFHVMSYQTCNNDLKDTFATVHAHLKPGGLFLFDCWYGPGVLTDRPAIRNKELEDDYIKVSRCAEPVLNPNENTVDVNYRISVMDKASGHLRKINETHSMRYLFLPEITEYLAVSGLQQSFAVKWLTNSPPDDTTWYLCCGATATGAGE